MSSIACLIHQGPIAKINPPPSLVQVRLFVLVKSFMYFP